MPRMNHRLGITDDYTISPDDLQITPDHKLIWEGTSVNNTFASCDTNIRRWHLTVMCIITADQLYNVAVDRRF